MKFLLLFLIQSLLLCFVSSNSDYDVYVKAQNLLKKKLSLIYNRFELNTPEGTALFTVPQNLPTTLWDINKNKFALNILEKSEYKTLFSGSSVTAGHDNYYNQSYPFVYERALKPVFDILDVDFIVHNIAQGTNPCSPYVYCYETMGGFIPDTFIWEQVRNCLFSLSFFFLFLFFFSLFFSSLLFSFLFLSSLNFLSFSNIFFSLVF